MPELNLICIGCACSDEESCPEGCYWIRRDSDAGVGVCSSCEEHTLRFDNGDYSQWAGPLEPERGAGELILPGDPEFHL